jgi:hypothetical protein
MKSILKLAAIFVLGLVIGGGVVGYFVDRVYRARLALFYSSQVGADALLAEQLRGGLAHILLESADRRLVEGIPELVQNDELKDLYTSKISLAAAKRYYVCTKTQIPPEIAPILNDLPPEYEMECSEPE